MNTSSGKDMFLSQLGLYDLCPFKGKISYNKEAIGALLPGFYPNQFIKLKHKETGKLAVLMLGTQTDYKYNRFMVVYLVTFPKILNGKKSDLADLYEYDHSIGRTYLYFYKGEQIIRFVPTIGNEVILPPPSPVPDITTIYHMEPELCKELPIYKVPLELVHFCEVVYSFMTTPEEEVLEKTIVSTERTGSSSSEEAPDLKKDDYFWYGIFSIFERNFSIITKPLDDPIKGSIYEKLMKPEVEATDCLPDLEKVISSKRNEIRSKKKKILPQRKRISDLKRELKVLEDQIEQDERILQKEREDLENLIRDLNNLRLHATKDSHEK